VLKTVYRSSCRNKHNRQRRDLNLGPLTPQSDALTTQSLRPVDGVGGIMFLGCRRILALENKVVNKLRIDFPLLSTIL